MYTMLPKVYYFSFMQLQLVCLTDRWLTYYKNKDELFDLEHLLSTEINERKGKHGKYSVKVSSAKQSVCYLKRIWKLQYESADVKGN